MAEPPLKKYKMENYNQSDLNVKASNVKNNASQDMFEESLDDDDDDWAGVPLADIPRLVPGSTLPSQYPHPHPGVDHTVCVQLPLAFGLNGLPRPHPEQLKDVWDGHHVRLPWSKENLYPVEDKNVKGKKVLRSRWELVIEALTKDKLSNSYDLEDAILTYNSRYRGKPDWAFSAMHTLFTEELEQEETEMFFNSTLPGMVDLLVSSPTVLTSPVPLLVAGSSHSITFSQHQVAVLLINAFFCTFPRRNAKAGSSEFASYPSINFNTLYGTCFRRPEAHLEKLKCLLSYFHRVVSSCPRGLITYSRKVVPASGIPNWIRSSKSFSKLHMASKGLIEVEGRGMLQADFANKFVGGGVLRSGLVQEEIRFTVCPELIASLLFTEVLGDREVLVVVGVEQFTLYEGYADNFKFSERFKDTVEVDSSGRKETSVVAMDAIRFTNTEMQFRTKNIERELNKAFVGFQNRHINRLQSVATGNWGCGAFGGDSRLKLLIQMMAAAEVGRDVLYLTFGDTNLVKDGGEMYNFLVKENITVGQLFQQVKNFEKSGLKQTGNDLFNWIYKKSRCSIDAEDAYSVDTDSDSDNDSGRDVEKDEDNPTNEVPDGNPERVELTESDKWLNDQMDEHIASTSNDAKNGGFFAALDKMEKGELEKNKNALCPIEAALGLASEPAESTKAMEAIGKGKKSKENGANFALPNQSKVTDFFHVKNGQIQ